MSRTLCVTDGSGSDASYGEEHQPTEGCAAKPVPPAHQAQFLPKVCISLLLGVSSLEETTWGAVEMTKQVMVSPHCFILCSSCSFLHVSPPHPHSTPCLMSGLGTRLIVLILQYKNLLFDLLR